MSIMIIFAMYFVLKGKYVTIKMILVQVLGKYFDVHHQKKLVTRLWNKLMDKKEH